jgi:hypothetical protein
MSFRVTDTPASGARYVFAKRKGEAWAKEPRAQASSLRPGPGQPAPKPGPGPGTAADRSPTTDLALVRGGVGAGDAGSQAAPLALPGPNPRVAMRSKSMTELESGLRCWGTHGCRGLVTRKCLTCEEFGWLKPAHLCDDCFVHLHVCTHWHHGCTILRVFMGVGGG